MGGAGQQRRVEQCPERIKVGIELAVGQSAVGGNDRGNEVAGLDDGVGHVRLDCSAAELAQLVSDALHELGDVVMQGGRHRCAHYGVVIGQRSRRTRDGGPG